jgi:SSS family solute:Na+ symporter
MQLRSADIFVVVAYFSLLTAFGLFARRSKRLDDYSVARRSAPTFIVLASLAATYIGPGYSLGLAAKAYKTGFFFLAFFVFFSLQTVLVGAWLAPRLKRFPDAHTLGDVMSQLYGSTAQLLTGIISTGLCVGFTAVLARAGGAVLANAIGLTLPVAILIALGVAVTYTYTGGLKLVIGVESVQFGIIIIAAAMVLLFSAPRIDSFAAMDRNALGLTCATWKATPSLSLLGLALSFALGECLIPPYANRALAGRSEEASKWGFVLGGFFSVIWFSMMIAAGMIAREIVQSTADPEGILVSLAATVLPSGLFGLFLVAVACIVMSTEEALLNAAAVCLTRDLSARVRSWSEKKQLTIAKVATLVFAIVAVWLALKAPGIIDGLLICYSLWATTVLPPLVWGVAGLPVSRSSGVLSIIFGAAATGFMLVGKKAGGDPAIALLVGLVGCAVGAVVGLMFKSAAYGIPREQDPKVN